MAIRIWAATISIGAIVNGCSPICPRASQRAPHLEQRAAAAEDAKHELSDADEAELILEIPCPT